MATNTGRRNTAHRRRHQYVCHAAANSPIATRVFGVLAIMVAAIVVCGVVAVRVAQNPATQSPGPG